MKNRLEKQLNGFLNTPSLWENEFAGIQQFSLPLQIAVDSLNPLENLPSLQHNFVLGKRMESFFELLLQYSENYEILAVNTQLFREKITIGELDFLLKNLKNNSVLHIEMVYKFYCYDPSFKEENQRWIGPNRRDTLLRKIEKLKYRQFPLLFEAESREFLQEFNLQAENFKQLSCFKANLFLPKYSVKTDFSMLNKNCVAGYYISLSEFLTPHYKNQQFYIPQKQDWPIAPGYGDTWFPYLKILPEIEKNLNSKKSPLVWMKKETGQYERFFVVWW